MHRSTGYDAPGKGRNEKVWHERKSDRHIFQMRVDKEFWSEVKEFASERQTTVSQLVRYLLAKEMNKGL